MDPCPHFIRYGQHHVPIWSWHVLPGRHEGCTFWSVWGGRGGMRLGGTSYELRAGDVFFIDYRKDVHAYQDNANPLRVRYVDFTPSDPALTVDWPEHRHFDQFQFISDLFDRLRSAQHDEDAARRHVWLQAITSEYLSVWSRPVGGRHSERIAEFCGRLQRHPERSYDIRALARDFGCAHDHFIRLFRRERGISPYAYLQKIRLDAAKVLLLNSNNTITEIARSCGFPNVCDFSRFFRLKTGATPSSYRKQSGRPNPPRSPVGNTGRRP